MSKTLRHWCRSVPAEVSDFYGGAETGISADKLRNARSGRCRRFSAELLLLLMFLM